MLAQLGAELGGERVARSGVPLLDRGRRPGCETQPGRERLDLWERLREEVVGVEHVHPVVTQHGAEPLYLCRVLATTDVGVVAVAEAIEAMGG